MICAALPAVAAMCLIEKNRARTKTGKRFKSEQVSGSPNIFTCTCYDYCDRLDGVLYADMGALWAERTCASKHANFARTDNAGQYDCTCTLACASYTKTDGTLLSHTRDTDTNNFPTVAQTESLCSHEVSWETSFDEHSFLHTSGTIQDKCVASGNAVPYRFTRDGQGTCTCGSPIKKNAQCVGMGLRSMISIVNHAAKFNAFGKDELPACYKPCITTENDTLTKRELCYADAIKDAVSEQNIPFAGQWLCKAMAFYNSYNYQKGTVSIGDKTYNCTEVEAILDGMKNSMGTGPVLNCDSPEYIWIQAPSSISP